eukprot:9190091-Pyramimonas_sp.AAC.1
MACLREREDAISNQEELYGMLRQTLAGFVQVCMLALRSYDPRCCGDFLWLICRTRTEQQGKCRFRRNARPRGVCGDVVGTKKGLNATAIESKHEKRGNRFAARGTHLLRTNPSGYKFKEKE